MENLMTLELEAHNVERNHHRRYEVMIGRDLLDCWTVRFRNGRVGQSGRVTRFSSTQPDELKAIIRDRLKRRLSAPQRIGCSYQIVACGGQLNEDWLPMEVMSLLRQR